jgi:hypothetical protein
MKTILKHLAKTALAAVAVLLAACEAEPIVIGGDPGNLPYANMPDVPSGALYAEGSIDPDGQDFVISADKTINLVYRLTSPAEADVTVTLELGTEDDVNAYNDAKGLVDDNAYSAGYPNRYRLLPKTNYSLPAALTLTVPKGQTESQTLAVEVKYSDALIATDMNYNTIKVRCPWMLPFKVVDVTGPVAAANRTLGIGVKVRGLEAVAGGDYPLDTDYLTVLYLNTDKYQPLLANCWVFSRDDWEQTRALGNIVNLRVTQLGYDAATGRALFVPSKDMRYVLEHATKYIRPLQDRGRKVCFSIEGAGTGLGFCNLTDAQIADFVSQVKTYLELYDIDGVNLFDRYSGYDKEGMPAMNTTSYPKLIKALREALGPDKLITLSDYEEPTEYFWDTGATGGIAVGDYIDYAWSGYMSEDEDIQLLDPYGTVTDPDAYLDSDGYSIILSEHSRKPIAGLEIENFGHFSIPFYPEQVMYDNDPVLGGIGVWHYYGLCPNNIVVFADIMSNEQSKYEGSWIDVQSTFFLYYGEGSWDFTYSYSFELLGYYDWAGGYGYMLKDW